MWRLLGFVCLLTSCSTTAKQPAGSGQQHPLGSGSVEFIGLDEETLQEIRVIPEEGRSLFVPRGGVRIENVDGFWWSGTRKWFKIPDHCHIEIRKSADGFVSEPACSQLGTRIQKMRGGVTEPRWVEDSGATAHPTDFPF